MKRILSLIMVLCLLPIVMADTEVDIDVTSSETINADITLNGANQNVNVNGGQLANKGDIRTGVRGRITEIIVEGVLAIQDGTLYNPIGVHAQAQIIGQVLLDTFITRGEVDLLYEEFKYRLFEDISSGAYEIEFMAYLEEKERQKSTTTTTIQEETVPTTEELNCENDEQVRKVYVGKDFTYKCASFSSGNEIPEVIGPVLLS